MPVPTSRAEFSFDDSQALASEERRPETGDALSPAYVRLSRWTTFKIGGRAREFYTPSTPGEFRILLGKLASEGKDPFFLGGGANTLFPDGEYTRPVISLERFRGVEVENDYLTAESGVRLETMISTAIRSGLGGLEVFVGIPGTCGGAVTMNAGGSGWSFGERVVELGVMHRRGGPVERIKGSEVSWEYRTANLRGYVVLWARLKLQRGDTAGLRQRAGQLMRRKLASQPLGAPSAGCVFRNPPGYHAGELIDRFGLKGLSSGGAKISERHANFIINATGSATASDVKALVARVSEVIEQNIGVRMETEVVLA